MVSPSDKQQHTAQDKAKEIQFFARHAQADAYNVFTEDSNRKIIARFVQCSGLRPGSRVADLGCGSGVFSNGLRTAGYRTVGIDLSEALLHRASLSFPGIAFVAGDVEALPIASESLDGILLSGIVHHLPDPSPCAREVFRVLRRGGSFVAFDPNRLNPFMYLYRDRSSPFYSSEGVTENERPALPRRTAEVFRRAGFRVASSYLPDLRYRYVASARARWALPLYNLVTTLLFRPRFMAPFSAFVVTSGIKE